MAELKPCPFCGGEADVEWYVRIKTGYCYCKSCKTRMPNKLSKEEAIEAWNRRVNDGR